MRAVGLDVGERRIGVATGDTESRLAVPVGAIERTNLSTDIEKLKAIVAEREADTLVVGMPYSMSGRIGPQAETTQAFIDAVLQALEIDVVTVDERLTSVEAERRIRERPTSGRKRGARPEKGAIDAGAATVILQSWLDSR